MVPFASLAILQREGQLDYALSSGRTRSGSSDDKEYNFIQVFPGLWRHQQHHFLYWFPAGGR
ncbi:hypothetical protein LNQ52_07055 [Klebsiella pneumoniae subsp. pneumoniae]|nr:hypothetical protein [Klebsiella pneumoniae subsp. pneumoniae]